QQPDRPALLHQGLRPPRDCLGSNLVHGRRLHAELPTRADADRADEVAEHEGPALPVRQGRGGRQALLLPDGDLAGPAGRPLRLPKSGHVVPEGRDRLGRRSEERRVGKEWGRGEEEGGGWFGEGMVSVVWSLTYV